MKLVGICVVTVGIVGTVGNFVVVTVGNILEIGFVMAGAELRKELVNVDVIVVAGGGGIAVAVVVGNIELVVTVDE